jgi:DNA-binding transcriptional MerR regulator
MIGAVTSKARNPLLTIGDFARLTRLTVKALRIYDESRLLRPHQVDPSTGYRFYSSAQAPRARLIGLLRASNLGLAEIAQLLAELDSNPAQAIDRLDRHLKQLEAEHTSRRVLIRHVHAVIRREEPPMFSIHTRHVAAQRVMTIQRRLRGHETDDFVAEARAAFQHHLNGQSPTGPFTLIFHGVVDDESDGPLEATLACPDDVDPSDLIGIRTEPAHDEAFTTITKAQWEYPAILAAYDAVASSPHVTARRGSRLSCREVYVSDPDTVGDDDLVCDIAYPLGETPAQPEDRPAVPS